MLIYLFNKIIFRFRFIFVIIKNGFDIKSFNFFALIIYSLLYIKTQSYKYDFDIISHLYHFLFYNLSNNYYI